MHLKFLVSARRLEQLANEAGLRGASIVLESLDDSDTHTRPATDRPDVSEAPEVSGHRVALRSDAVIYPASMIKLPIAVALATLREAHALALTDAVTVTEANMTANDAPSLFVPGYAAELGELASAMLAASDNVATNVLIDVLGRDAITAACAAFGLRATAVRRKLSGALPLIDDPAATGRNAHPAADAATLLRRLAGDRTRGGALRFVYDALAVQIWNDKLSRGLAPGDAFAHKTGDTDEVSHDGGILTLANGRRFVLVVYTTLPSNAQTDARFAAFMRALRPHLEG